jgi:hypothetical protein
VDGSAAVTGNAQIKTTDVYTGVDFSISGANTSFTDYLGAVYVTKTLSWKGGTGGSRLGVQTTVDGGTEAQPLFAQIFSLDGNVTGTGDNSSYDGSSGPYDVVLGNVWIDGNAGTGDIGTNFSAPSTGIASTVLCPLWATTERTVSNGFIDFGSIDTTAIPKVTAQPMVYYMQCDNDGLYSNTCTWASTGQFVGVMVLFEASIEISGGSATRPSIVGSVMDGVPIDAGYVDITLSGNSLVAYNQAVIENLPANLQAILRTNTTTAVPGTWQQLPAN